MRKFLLIVSFVVATPLVLMGATCTDICFEESKRHVQYMTYVAPFRTPTQVGNAIAYHTQVQAACATGRPLAIIKALITKAREARQ